MTYALQARRARFVTDGVAAASPQTLLVLLCDRFVLDLDRAETAQRAGDGPAANTQLQHAQQILTELLNALDVEAWDGAADLGNVYRFLQVELSQANITRDADRTAKAREVFRPLAEAWRRAVSGAGTSASVSTTTTATTPSVLGGTA